jgi:hypothetical protein
VGAALEIEGFAALWVPRLKEELPFRFVNFFVGKEACASGRGRIGTEEEVAVVAQSWPAVSEKERLFWSQ